MEYAVSVIKNVLGALYQTGGASLIIAALFMSAVSYTHLTLPTTSRV